MTDAQAIPQSGGARPGAFAIWLQAVRAPSLSAAAVPVLLGTAVAARDGYFHGLRMLIALIGAVAIQAGTNLINDYYDFRSGADSHDSLGPSMVIQRGLLTPEQVWRGGIVAFAIGAALGLMLVYLCGWPVLAIGIPSIAAGYFYTAAPVSLAYIGLGELTVFLFMGPAIVLGAYYVMALTFSWSALWASVALGFLVAGILHANNIRDIETDGLHGKHTLATILGRERRDLGVDHARCSRLRDHAYRDPRAYAAVDGAVGTITLPRARDQIRIVRSTTDAKKLNLALMRSVQLHMEFGILMIIAFVAAAIFKW